MPIERFKPAGLTNSPAYSQVVKAGNTVYVAGQVAVDAQGKLVGRGDFAMQAAQVWENLGKALASAGAGYQHLVKTTVFLTDGRFRDAYAEARTRYLGEVVPASTLLVVAGLASPDYLIELEGIAVLD